MSAKDVVRGLLPLETRKHLAAWLTRNPWLPVPDHVVMGLVRDFQVNDPKGFHKFAWAHHLMGVARWYDAEDELFSPDQMQPSRIEFFADLVRVLEQQGVPAAQVRSVLEVGCSLGFLLRHLETHVLPQCETLVGIDIDAPGIEKGRRYLSDAGSRVTLVAGDMEEFEARVGPRQFDVVFAAGVLSYLNEADATEVVRRMLARTDHVLALAGLAWADADNCTLAHSIISPFHEGQWLHNFDRMVRNAGGRVLSNRWEGATQYNFQTICFCFAAPK